MAINQRELQRGQRRPGPQPPQTYTQRSWKGLNVTDSRLSLDEDELYRCENAMPLGRGLAPTPLYNGAAGAVLHASTIKESFGAELTYGAFTVPHPVTITIWNDGAAWQRDHFNDGAVDTQIAPPGTFSAPPLQTGITIWQDGPILIIDDTAGYYKWDGVTLTVIDATKKGHALAVFSGYTFLVLAARTILVTAPNTFDNFTAGAGSTTFRITDDAFQGAIIHLLSTVSQLWIDGVSALDALGNISTTGGVTTFAVTNAVSTLGSAFGDSLIGYYRSLVFYTGYSIHSLLGVTPQKLSGKIDQLFRFLSGCIPAGPRPGVVQLNGTLVLAMLFQYTDPVTGVVGTRLVCFSEGKFFLATTPDLAGNRILDMVTLTINTTPEVYGIDASGREYRIFARPSDLMKGTVVISSKLSDGGNPIVGQQQFKVGFDFSTRTATGLTTLTIDLTTEQTTLRMGPFSQGFFPAVDAWLGERYSLYRSDARMSGQRLGWTLQYPCADQVTLEAAHLEVGPTNEWDTVISTPGVFRFINADLSTFNFINADGSPYVFLDG